MNTHRETRWSIITDGASSQVEAWSTFRIPFEPSSLQEPYRSELREALSGLTARRRSMIRAEYVHPDMPESCDVENVLFYNIGASAFSKLAAEGIMFEYGKSRPPPSPNGDIFEHYTRYETVPIDSGFLRWLPQTENGIELRGVPCDYTGGELKPGLVWRWIQWFLDSKHSLPMPRPFPGEFAVEVAFDRGWASNLCTIIKPLLDGLISTCHSKPRSVDGEVVRRVAAQLDEKPDTIQGWLMRDDLCALSDHCPVKVYRNGVMWHPDDHLCVAGVVRQRPRSTEDSLRMDVTIYPVISS